jgi:hypothetical protein
MRFSHYVVIKTFKHNVADLAVRVVGLRTRNFNEVEILSCDSFSVRTSFNDLNFLLLLLKLLYLSEFVNSIDLLFECHTRVHSFRSSKDESKNIESGVIIVRNN